MKSVVLVLSLFFFVSSAKIVRKARVDLKPAGGGLQRARGTIFLEEDDKGVVRIHGPINGLEKSFHGLHIHERGSEDCDAAGDHFNPDRVSSGTWLRP